MSATPQKLKREYLRSEGESTSSYTRAVIDGKAVAHAFVSRWKCEDWTVCWVTQLVVDKRFRRQGLATGVLKALRRNTDDVYGIVSSHPAACMAAAKAFGSKSYMILVLYSCCGIQLLTDYETKATSESIWILSARTRRTS